MARYGIADVPTVLASSQLDTLNLLSAGSRAQVRRICTIMQETSLRGPRNLSADLLSWPGKQARTVLLFIPGNPGLVHYYTHFLTSLQDRLTETGLGKFTARRCPEMDVN